MAGLMLLAHSFMPHEHHEENALDEHIVEQESAESLLDFLKLAFHFNQGENHLEELEVPQNFQAIALPYSFLVEAISFEPLFFEVTTNGFSHHLSIFQNHLLDHYLSFRGPPLT